MRPHATAGAYAPTGIQRFYHIGLRMKKAADNRRSNF